MRCGSIPRRVVSTSGSSGMGDKGTAERREILAWLEAEGWRLEAGGWRLEAGGWRLEAGGWRLEAGQCADLRLTLDKLFRPAFQPPAPLSASTPPPSPGCSPSARRRRTPTARRIRAPAERSPATRDPRPGHR